MKPITNQLAGNLTWILFPMVVLWRRSRKQFFLVIIVTAVGISGCFQHYYRTNARSSASQSEIQKLIHADKYIILHYADTITSIRNGSLRGDTLWGEATEVLEEHKKALNPFKNKADKRGIPDNKAVVVKKKDKIHVLREVHMYTSENLGNASQINLPLPSVNRIDVYEFDKQTTTTNHIMSWVGVSVLSISAITLLIYAMTCNCPQVYVHNGQAFEFTSGIYSGAVHSALERNDYLPLTRLAATNGKYQVQIHNFPGETQYINRLQLLSVRHPEGSRVLIDRHGTLLSTREAVQPLTAVHNQSAIDPGVFTATDGIQYDFSSDPNENGVSEIRLRFQKPGGVNTGKLVVHAGNTAWSGYLNREFISLFGGSYETWRQQQEALKVTDPMKWQIEQSLPIKVFVRAGKEWKFIDYFIHTGNTASRDMIMQLDLRGIEGREVELKLEAAYRFWQVDRVAMDFTTESGITSNYLAMTSAEKAGGAQQLANLAADDNRYTILEQQEQVSLEFSATELEPESNSSLFLVSSGYYHVNSEFGGAAQLKELGAFRQAGHYDRFSRERYRRMDSLLSVARVNR